jgi:hypothetical protein
LGITELPNEVGGSHERTILVLLIIGFGSRNGKSRGFNGAGYPARVKNITCRQAVHHKHLGPVDVIGKKSGIRRFARQFCLVTGRVDDVPVRSVAFEQASNVADVVQEARNDNMGIITGKRGNEERASLHNVVPSQRHQHRMFDIMVECVAVPDALERKPGH